jgi:hypothetical protein
MIISPFHTLLFPSLDFPLLPLGEGGTVEKRRGGERGVELFVTGPLFPIFPLLPLGEGGMVEKRRGKACGKGNSLLQVLSFWIFPPMVRDLLFRQGG